MRNVKFRNLLFSGLFILFIILTCFPGIFDWSNRVEPFVIGMPFSYFWQILMNCFIFATLITWFLVDSKYGDLDLDVEPLSNEELEARRG